MAHFIVFAAAMLIPLWGIICFIRLFVIPIEPAIRSQHKSKVYTRERYTL